MWGNVVFRTVIYYALLVGVAALTWEYLPPTDVGGAGSDGHALTGSADIIARIADDSLTLSVFLAMATAVLVSIPVAWIYTFTRQKRGFQQSVVQMLVLLPPVVAGIVMLVKHSLALAFSLAGAAAAVRFRNPDYRLPITTVRQRLFRGYCAPPEQFARVFALFNEQKPAIYALYSDHVGRLMNLDVARRTLEYFDDFYEMINDPRRAADLVRSCRQAQ